MVWRFLSFGAPIVSGPIHGSSKGVILRFLALPAMNVDLLELTLALQQFHYTLQKRKLKYHFQCFFECIVQQCSACEKNPMTRSVEKTSSSIIHTFVSEATDLWPFEMFFLKFWSLAQNDDPRDVYLYTIISILCTYIFYIVHQKNIQGRNNDLIKIFFMTLLNETRSFPSPFRPPNGQWKPGDPVDTSEHQGSAWMRSMRQSKFSDRSIEDEDCWSQLETQM